MRRPDSVPIPERLICAYRGLLLVISIAILVGLIILCVTVSDHANQVIDCVDHGILSSFCDDSNPCTADKILLDDTCANRNWPSGTPCESTCLVPGQTSSLCVAGKCLALSTDCLGYCPHTYTEDCEATDPDCLAATGCPALPLGVNYLTLLPAGIAAQRVACVLHSCRYGIFTLLPSLQDPTPQRPQPSTSAACSEWLNRSFADVREGCYDAVRIDYAVADLINTPFAPPGFPPNFRHSFPQDVSAAVGCTFSYHCAPYDTTLPPVVVEGATAAQTVSAVSLLGSAAQTGSTSHNGYAARSLVGMAAHAFASKKS